MNAQFVAPDTLPYVLRLPQVCQVTGLCRSMIYQLEAEQRFPRRIKIGTRAVGWLEGEVQTWLASRVQSSRGPNSKASQISHHARAINLFVTEGVE